MKVKEYTCVKKSKNKRIYNFIKPVCECTKRLKKNDKVEIEYYLIIKRIKYTIALYFLRGKRIIGEVYPYENCRSNKKQSSLKYLGGVR
jgi:hypothetical protein